MLAKTGHEMSDDIRMAQEKGKLWKPPPRLTEKPFPPVKSYVNLT